jgi:uridine kinase
MAHPESRSEADSACSTASGGRMKRDQVLDALETQLLAMPSRRPQRVAIDGRVGAGKTTLADELADRLEAKGRPCLRTSLDDFHFPGYRQRAASNGFTPEAFLREGHDYASFERLVLEPLGRHGNRRCRLDLWNAFDDEPFPEEWVDAPDDVILLADGVFLLGPSLRPLWEFTLWLDVDWDVMLRRAASRDPARVTSLEPIRGGPSGGWLERHTLYEQLTRPHDFVNVVVDNSDLKHPYLVRSRAAPRRVP